MKVLSGLLGLMRVNNMIICGLSVVTGGLLSGKPTEVMGYLITGKGNGVSGEAFGIMSAAFSAAFILAAGNILNDIMDIETDRINAPDRPLPSGRVGLPTALIMTVLLAVAGLAAAIPLGTSGVAIALSAVILLFLYDIRLKATPFAGNLAVALLGGLTFVYGGIAGACINESFVPAAFATLLHLGREIIKDAEDYDGDRSVGIKTLATTGGVRFACRIAAAVLFILMIVTAVPAFGMFGSLYIVIIAIGVWPPVLYAMFLAVRKPRKHHLTTASRLLKYGMPAGLVAVLAGFQGL